jgi:hypothetical protein
LKRKGRVVEWSDQKWRRLRGSVTLARAKSSGRQRRLEKKKRMVPEKRMKERGKRYQGTEGGLIHDDRTLRKGEDVAVVLGLKQSGVAFVAAGAGADADDMILGTSRAARARTRIVVVERERCGWVLGKGMRCCCCYHDCDQYNGTASSVVGDDDGAAYDVAVVVVGVESEDEGEGGSEDGDGCCYCEPVQKGTFLGYCVESEGESEGESEMGVVVVGEDVLEGNQLVGTVSDDDDVVAEQRQRRSGEC